MLQCVLLGGYRGWWSALNTLCSPARQVLMQCQALVWTELLPELKSQLCSLLPEVFCGFLSHLHTLRWNSVFLMQLFRAWSSTWYIINVPGGKGAPKHPNWLHPGNNFSCHWDVSLSRIGVCVGPFPYGNQGWQGRWLDATDFLFLFTFWDLF